jgi:hypothetical protein
MFDQSIITLPTCSSVDDYELFYEITLFYKRKKRNLELMLV